MKADMRHVVKQWIWTISCQREWELDKSEYHNESA